MGSRRNQTAKLETSKGPVVSLTVFENKFINYLFDPQIVPQKLPEKSFWVKVDEEKLASADIFNGLVQKFSSKPATKRSNDVIDKYVLRSYLSLNFSIA